MQLADPPLPSGVVVVPSIPSVFLFFPSHVVAHFLLPFSFLFFISPKTTAARHSFFFFLPHFHRRGESSYFSLHTSLPNSLLLFRRHRFFDLFGILRGILKKRRGEKKKVMLSFPWTLRLNIHARRAQERTLRSPVTRKHDCIQNISRRIRVLIRAIVQSLRIDTAIIRR